MKLEPKDVLLDNWPTWSCCSKLNPTTTSDINQSLFRFITFLMRLLQMCRIQLSLQWQCWV